MGKLFLYNSKTFPIGDSIYCTWRHRAFTALILGASSSLLSHFVSDTQSKIMVGMNELDIQYVLASSSDYSLYVHRDRFLSLAFHWIMKCQFTIGIHLLFLITIHDDYFNAKAKLIQFSGNCFGYYQHFHEQKYNTKFDKCREENFSFPYKIFQF